MYQLNIKLKQHTPIIHFQAHQHGATLRASEVKPKLDKFILKCRSNNALFNTEEQVEYREMFDSIPIVAKLDDKKTTNSPYKLSIQQVGEVRKFLISNNVKQEKLDRFNNEYDLINNAPYFADNSNVNEYKPNKIKYGIMLCEESYLNLRFSFYNKKWEDVFSKVLGLFLGVHNFGTRQSKGFGCFYLLDKVISDFEFNLRKVTDLTYFVTSDNKQSEIFKKIDNVYTKLKTGVGKQSGYLRQFFLNKNIEWEKPKIQELVSKATNLNIKTDKQSDDIAYVRAVLGLAGLFEYPFHKNTKVNVVDVKNGIERYRSPIQIKVFNNKIYFTVVSQDYLDQDTIVNQIFSFTIGDSQTTIQTPKDFDLRQFLKFAFDRINGSKLLN